MVRVSKKKRPPREEKVFKEKKKIESRVFDSETLLVLADMFNRRILSSLDYPIAMGKEANIFRATAGEAVKAPFVAVKIFRIETSAFLHMQEYLLGDPRFENVKRDKKAVVHAWAQKEFKNLGLINEAGVPAPLPLFFQKNVLVMEFLGEAGVPASTLQQLGPSDPEADCRTVLGYIKRLFKAGFVHSDVSEYNIIVHAGKLYLIDCGQGVLLSHPKAMEFLERDVKNVLAYFAKYGVKRDFGETMRWVEGRLPPEL